MKYLLLDTSTPLCRLTLAVDGEFYEYEWQADRQLAKGLLEFIVDKLSENKLTLADFNGLAAMRGPGSFTGLRIGLSVLNTLADSLDIAIVGAEGEDWRKTALDRLGIGQNDQIVLPNYGAEARITQPKK